MPESGRCSGRAIWTSSGDGLPSRAPGCDGHDGWNTGRTTNQSPRRIGNEAHDAGVVARRIHLVVAIDRLLTRLLTGAPGRWVVKGGYANQLRRPDDARFTEDLDLRIDAAIETAPSCWRPASASPWPTISAMRSPRRRHPSRDHPEAASASSSSRASLAPNSSASRSTSVPPMSSLASSSHTCPTQSSSGLASSERDSPSIRSTSMWTAPTRRRRA